MPIETNIMQLAPMIKLHSVRLFVTTKSLTGTGSEPQFWYFKDLWQMDGYFVPMYFQRKAGGTDLLEQPVSLVYNDFQEARMATFQIVVRGSEIWEIDHLTMTGKFEQYGLLLNPQTGGRGPKTSWGWRDIGWRLMAFRDENIVADAAVGAGGYIHRIVLNGTF